MTRFLVLCIALVGPVVAADSTPSSSADEWKQRAERWLELERRTADEGNAWRAEREALETSRELMKTENERLQKRLDANALARDLFLKRLNTLQADLSEQETASTDLRAGLAAVEMRLRGVRERLPVPLREQVDDLFRRLNRGDETEGGAVTLSERAQTLVSIMTLMDQFNSRVTLTHHLYRDDDGGELDVQVLYWGLAMGLAVDVNGTRAWMLTPTDTGWSWQDHSDSAAAVRQLVDIHSREVRPALVSVPVALPEVQP